MKKADINRPALMGGDQAGQFSRESPSLPYLLLDQLPIGVFQKDCEGRYVFVNSWLCHLKEATLNEFIGKTAEEFAAGKWKSEDVERPERLREIKVLNEGAHHHKLIMETGQSIEVEEYHVGADGKEQYFHVIKGPLRGPDGAIVGSQGILLDITERKRAEAQLANERDMLRTLMD
ncbi:MAG: PAS domain-containing protein [Verrucomicrobiota bacterium]|jgi:PAS domain-containing protein